MLQYISWQTNSVLSRMTLWHIILTTSLIWILGIWLWVIPQYHLEQMDIEHEINRLEHFKVHYDLVKPKTFLPSSQLNNLPPLSYEALLALAAQRNLHLVEYQQTNHDQGAIRHRCVFRGEWLATREFLDDLQPTIPHDFRPVRIYEIAIQRNSQTNMIDVTFVMETGT
ncbi:hypothetical protein [Aquirhabdus parva]|nr:hypothetical protein [Aquirhabdus parva]